MIIHYALKGIVAVPAHVWITSPEYIVRSGITSPQLFFHIPARGVITYYDSYYTIGKYDIEIRSIEGNNNYVARVRITN